MQRSLNGVVDVFLHDLNNDQKVEFVRRCITRGIGFQEILSHVHPLKQQLLKSEEQSIAGAGDDWSSLVGKQLKTYGNARPDEIVEINVLEKTNKGYAVIGSRTGRHEYELCGNRLVHVQLGVSVSASIDKTTGAIQWSHGCTSRIEDSHPDKWSHFCGKQLETWRGTAGERFETCVLEKGAGDQYVYIGSKTGRQRYHLQDNQMVHDVFGPTITGHLEDGEIRWSHGHRTTSTLSAHSELQNSWFAIAGQQMETYRDGHPGHALETVMFEREGNYITALGSRSGRHEYVILCGQLVHREFGELISAKLNPSNGHIIWSYGCFSCTPLRSAGPQKISSSSKKARPYSGGKSGLLNAVQMSHIFKYCLGRSLKSPSQFAGVTRLSLVCSKWRAFATQIRWVRVDLSQKNIANAITDTRLRNLCVHSRGIQALSLYSCAKITDAGLAQCRDGIWCSSLGDGHACTALGRVVESIAIIDLNACLTFLHVQVCWDFSFATRRDVSRP